MSAKPKSPKPLDHKRLLEDCDAEQAFANRCLHIFVRTTQADINDIAAAFDRKDPLDVIRLAHRIKGASGSIRAEFLGKQAAALETLAAAGDFEAAQNCFSRLRTEFEHFNRYIAALPLSD